MTIPGAGVTPAWLSLREPADAAARATDLIGVLRHYLPAGPRTVVHDLGCGSGSMGRWLAPQLPGPQHWLCYDRDPDLLALTAQNTPGAAADGSPVTVETRRRDITRLADGELAGASLITASALLDGLTVDEVERIAEVCTTVGCPALIALTVVGRVELTPSDPLDEVIRGAFNAHQRRTVDGRRLLGPDAVPTVSEMFARGGGEVLMRPSPWRLDGADAALTTAWLAGWVGAAREQRPDLSGAIRGYAQRRAAAAAGGELGVTLHHQDVLALPRLRHFQR